MIQNYRKVLFFGLILTAAIISGEDAGIRRKYGVLLRDWIESGTGRVGVYPVKICHDRECVLVCVEGNEAAAAVRAAGGFVNTDAGQTVTAALTPDQIVDLAGMETVRRIRLGRSLRLFNDLAGMDTGAHRVHAGELPSGGIYKGKDVVVGILDTGIDITHTDFQHENGSTRILAVWDQMDSEGSPPGGFSYGREWTAEDIDQGNCTHQDTDGHGTHVSGTAAGNGRSGGGFYGMAPEADIVAVAIDVNNSIGIIDGANYVYQIAEQLGKSCVVNASLGYHYGPHDGTDIESQTLDALVEAAPGRAFCAAAGNEADLSMHLNYTGGVDSSWTYVYTNGMYAVYIYARVPDVSLDSVFFAVGADESNYNPLIRTGTPLASRGHTDWYSGRDIAEQLKIDQDVKFGNHGGGTVYFEAEEASDSVTGILIIIEENYLVWNENTQEVSDLELWRFRVRGTGPGIHAWVLDTWGRTYREPVQDVFYRMPDNEYSVGMPAVAAKTLAVGAVVNRNEFVNSDNVLVRMDAGEAGNLAAWSSRGPTVDGRFKPDICAPGAGIISTLSSAAYDAGSIHTADVTAGGDYVVKSGSSMACAVVSGCVALYLQKNPDADFDELYTKLTGFARKDGFTGAALPDNQWGFGKMAIYDMMDASAADDMPHNPGVFSLEQNYPNPFNSQTMVRYSLSEAGRVRLTIRDTGGRIRRLLVNQHQGSGAHTVSISCRELASGVYLYCLETGQYTVSRKMVVIK